MKYALVTVMDQTIGFYSEVGVESHRRAQHSDGEVRPYDITTRHPEAHLFDDHEEAYVRQIELALQDGCWWGMEEVIDEAEFRRREDTW